MLELGEALVAELGLEQSNDVLGRWMAHHLARLIEAARTSPSDERANAEERCFAAVLEVWRHRNCLPRGSRPFEPAERLLDVIEALDPDAPRPFYNRVALDWEDFDGVDRSNETEKQLLDVVREFDQIARTVLQHLLVRAAECLPAETFEWVRKAKAARLGERDLIAIERILVKSGDLGDVERQRQDARINALRAQIEQLDRFVATAEIVRDDIEGLIVAAESANQVGAERHTRPKQTGSPKPKQSG